MMMRWIYPLRISVAISFAMANGCHKAPDNEDAQGLRYEVINGTVSILCSYISDRNTRAIVIPGTIKGKPVTSIGPAVFCGCTNLTRVEIPAGVTNISGQAFNACSSLTEVYFRGNAPTIADDTYLGAPEVTSYYLPGTIGWSASFGGRPTAIWNPQTDAGQSQGNPAN